MLSGLKRKVKNRLRGFVASVVDDVLQEDLERHLQIARQMEEFRSAPAARRASAVEAQTDISHLLRQIAAAAIPLRTERIDTDDFRRWRKKYRKLEGQYKGLGDTTVEKVLEHYLTMTFLPYGAGDLLIDMAAAGSRLADILKKKTGQTCYKLDLEYPPGIRSERIGADVAQSGLPDAFADVLTFHCAFECLQGDADIRFVREAERILKKGGRWGIAPLYLERQHFVKLGPKNDIRAVTLGENEPWIWRDDSFLTSPFSRHYSPESFARRVVSRCAAFDCEIIHFANLEELQRLFPGQRLYCHFLFRAKKK